MPNNQTRSFTSHYLVKRILKASNHNDKKPYTCRPIYHKKELASQERATNQRQQPQPKEDRSRALKARSKCMRRPIHQLEINKRHQEENFHKPIKPIYNNLPKILWALTPKIETQSKQIISKMHRSRKETILSLLVMENNQHLQVSCKWVSPRQQAIRQSSLWPIHLLISMS